MLFCNIDVQENKQKWKGRWLEKAGPISNRLVLYALYWRQTDFSFSSYTYIIWICLPIQCLTLCWQQTDLSCSTYTFFGFAYLYNAFSLCFPQGKHVCNSKHFPWAFTTSITVASVELGKRRRKEESSKKTYISFLYFLHIWLLHNKNGVGVTQQIC